MDCDGQPFVLTKSLSRGIRLSRRSRSCVKTASVSREARRHRPHLKAPQQPGLHRPHLRYSHDNRACGLCYWLVLPEPQNCPTVVFEKCRLRSVPFNVALQFGTPVGGILCRLATMYRAAMPEAAVDENGELGPSENDVWTHSFAAHDESHVFPESQTSSMKK